MNMTTTENQEVLREVIQRIVEVAHLPVFPDYPFLYHSLRDKIIAEHLESLLEQV